MGNIETRFKEVSQQYVAAIKAVHKIEKIIESLHDEMDQIICKQQPDDYGQELQQKHGDEVV
jgi:hypothetical protein